MLNKIREKILLQLGDKNRQLADDDILVSSGLLSSLKIVELANWLEINYGIDFSAEAFNVYDFETLQAITEMVQRKQRELGKPQII